MKIHAITGGIACGKSQFGHFLTEKGAVVIEADELARKVISIGTDGLNQLKDRFSSSYFNKDGSLNRDKIRELIVRSPFAKRTLEAVIHPLVQKALDSLLEYHKTNGNVQDLFYIIPLFFETNQDRTVFESILVIASSRNICLNRIVQRNSLSLSQANDLINLQIPIEKKIKLANQVIYNNGTLDMLKTSAINYLNGIVK